MRKNRDGSWSEKANFHLESHMSIPWLLGKRLALHPTDVCIERKSRFGSTWEPLTVAAFDSETTTIAAALLSLGLRPGEKIAILAPTSYEWSLLDVAALSVGIVVVPIYESDSAEQIQWILTDADVRLSFADTRAHLELIESVREKGLPTRLLDEDGLAHLRQEARSIAPSAVARAREGVRASNLATIIYTSGTTGRPKGVELTHANFVASTLAIFQSEEEIINTTRTRVLLFLPLAHIMARIVFYYAIAGRGRVGHLDSTANLVSDLASFKPTALLVVPRVLEKIYNAAEAKSGGGKRLKIFRWAAHVAERNSRKRFHGPIFRVKRFFARHLVWKKMTAILGVHCRFAVSAGAPLGTRLGHIFRGIGLTVVEAFGLTETTGPATANRPKHLRMGSVGIPIPGTSVAIAQDGEVLLAGPHIMHGYHNNPEATAEVIDSHGWFHTGDVGNLDKHGFLTITGRKKDLIVTAGGKNVAPAVLEDPLSGHPLISHVVVVGDKRPFVGALITLDTLMLPGWLSMHGLPPMDEAQARTDPRVLASLQKAIDRTNVQVSRAESIRKFVVLNGEFSQDNGLLTPSLKVKRQAVIERFSTEIEQLYRDTRK